MSLSTCNRQDFTMQCTARQLGFFATLVNVTLTKRLLVRCSTNCWVATRNKFSFGEQLGLSHSWTHLCDNHITTHVHECSDAISRDISRLLVFCHTMQQALDAQYVDKKKKNISQHQIWFYKNSGNTELRCQWNLKAMAIKKRKIRDRFLTATASIL